jgi:hypothetical protein
VLSVEPASVASVAGLEQGQRVLMCDTTPLQGLDHDHVIKQLVGKQAVDLLVTTRATKAGARSRDESVAASAGPNESQVHAVRLQRHDLDDSFGFSMGFTSEFALP